MTLAAMAGPAWGQLGGGGWAQSLFSEGGINFGPVPRGAKVRHNFVLTNRTNEAITILDVRASCGCTSGRASASQVLPGGQAVVEAQMDTRNFVGLKATTLTVSLVTASGRQGEARFGVQSNILPDVVLNPGSVDFGLVARGATPQQVVSIERLGNPNWQFTRLIASEAFCRVVDAKLQPSYRNANGVGYNLVVALKPDAPAGAVRDEIRLLTNDPQTPNVPILVTAQVQGSLTATPALLSLGNVTSAAGAQGRYIVRSNRPFSIREIQGNGEGFTLAAPDATPKPLHVLTLTFQPEATTMRGDLRRAFRVVTDLADEAPLDLTATARVAP
jgi:hypothetical protein